MPTHQNATYTLEEPASAPEPIPLVIVEGFLGGSGESLWGNFAHYLNGEDEKAGCGRRRVIFANVGPVSSLHDRACELFYDIVGGTVDYGEAHSIENGHARYGRASGGLYPAWSVDNPLHFLGHSVGGATIVKLQKLLSDGVFGPAFTADMLLSVTAGTYPPVLSAPFRGTQIVYSLGEHETAAPEVRFLSLGSALAKAIHVAAYFAPFMSRFVDLRGEARRLSLFETSFASMLKQLWKSDWAESRDAAPFDVTFQAADEREASGEGTVNARTYYRSYAACMTEKIEGGNTHQPIANHFWRWLSPLNASSSVMGSYEFSVLRPVPSFLLRPVHSMKAPQSFQQLDILDSLEDGIPEASDDPALGEEFWANDGVVPLFSQWHPLECRTTRCKHKHSPDAESVPEAGVWYVYPLERAHHQSVMPIWWGNQRQKEFWQGLGPWLRRIDTAFQPHTRIVETLVL
ncbi:alpha/beta-hydrolase [Artomyces pyxidatus]|uniref:Alpha/beta-hydrolase n=1 Tax=Artomyces pyxidatus TaxID=48021 RepID=A0ACB8TI93_9AGAM|nr:alpha/beta-hydrolase [Artomyces pyxidatus]